MNTTPTTSVSDARFGSLLVLTFGLTLCAVSASAQSVIYRETFGNNSGGAQLSLTGASTNWSLYLASTQGGNAINDSGANHVSASASVPNNVGNVNAGTSLSTTNGYVFGGVAAQALLFTAEYTIDTSVFTPSTVTWYATRDNGATGTAPSMSFAALVGGNWYVANFSSSISNLAGTSNSGLSPNTAFSVNLTSATWNALSSPTVGAPLSVSATSGVLPTGNVTGFGIYVTDMGSANWRIDSVEISATAAVPEPSAYAALAGLGALGLATCHRRRR